jgi:hypothetical protein
MPVCALRSAQCYGFYWSHTTRIGTGGLFLTDTPSNVQMRRRPPGTDYSLTRGSLSSRIKGDTSLARRCEYLP